MTLSGDITKAEFIKRHPVLVRFITGVMSLSPEAFLLVLGLIGIHYGTLIMFPETAIRHMISVHDEPVQAYAFITSLAWPWGVFTLFVGCMSLASFFCSLMSISKRYAFATWAAIADALLWAWITYTFLSEGQTLNVCKIYILYFILSFLTCLLISERRSRLRERWTDNNNCKG